MNIRIGTEQDINGVSALYDALHEYLEAHINYPGWKRGIYPIREDAEQGNAEGSLFVAEENGSIIGSFILRHIPENGYEKADWHIDLEYCDIFVLYIFVVHPQFQGKGVAKAILEFVFDYATRMQMKAVRLDVYEKNLPAIRLYESVGFEYIDTVD